MLRVPVAFALGLACLPLLYLEPRLGTMMIVQETFNAYNTFILLAVPFFLLTANLMSVGGITDRLVALSRALVGSWPGSLAQINVVLSVFFAGISGSSTADAASQSKIFIDAQTKEGYDLSFSIAITAVFLCPIYSFEFMLLLCVTVHLPPRRCTLADNDQRNCDASCCGVSGG